MIYRTHNCNELTEDDIGLDVVLSGWVNSVRDHGGVIFVDLRDRYGITQVVFNPKISAEAHSIAEKLHDEYVIRVEGEVTARSPETINPKLPTGHIEVMAKRIEILSKSDVLPFQIEDDINVSEEVRLKYRFLDLRRRPMAHNIITKHKIMRVTREYFYKKDFLEIETPFLTKSTPEGARDYLVPSRIYPGYFYALPQSPQLFKQILMVSGFDKYFQIVKCFRDEDLRADRQPEFTQIDVEMAFVDEEDIYRTIEGLLKEIFKIAHINVKLPIKRLRYEDAMKLYGTDKPDLRNPLRLYEVEDIVAGSQFKVFTSVLEQGGMIRGLNAVGCADFSRKDIDDLTKYVGNYGARGLAWFKVTSQGPESSIGKFFTPQQLKALQERMQAKEGDLLLFVADKPEVVLEALSHLRDEVARRKGLIREDAYEFVWITDFPLFEYSATEKRWVSMHHPFTSPKDEDLALLDEDPGKVRSKAYDIVLNGVEIGGGSIRIHNNEVQRKVFQILGITEEESERKFSFLMRAFQFGAPPHGGIALGLDRVAMIITGSKSIRDVIPFPKTQKAVCPLTGAPSEVDERQLRELHLKIDLS